MAFILFDEHLGVCQPVGEFLPPPRPATVRDLIRARVALQIERMRSTPEPSDHERRLNPDGALRGFDFGLRPEASTRAEEIAACVAAAEAAFIAGSYVLLLGDRQAESLDEAIDFGRTRDATFLMITPLKGG